MNKAHSLIATTLVSLATVSTLVGTNASAQANTTQPSTINSTRTLAHPSANNVDAIAKAKVQAADATKKIATANAEIKSAQDNINRLNAIKAKATPEQLQQTQIIYDQAQKTLKDLTNKQAAAQKKVELAKTPQEKTNAQNELNTATKNLNNFWHEYDNAYDRYKSIRISSTNMANLQVDLKYAKMDLKQAQDEYAAAEQILAPTKTKPTTTSKSTGTATPEASVTATHTQNEPTVEKSTASSQPTIHQHTTPATISSATDTSKKAPVQSGSHVLPQTGEHPAYLATFWGASLSLFLGMFTLVTKFRQRHNH